MRDAKIQNIHAEAVVSVTAMYTHIGQKKIILSMRMREFHWYVTKLHKDETCCRMRLYVISPFEYASSSMSTSHCGIWIRISIIFKARTNAQNRVSDKAISSAYSALYLT